MTHQEAAGSWSQHRTSCLDCNLRDYAGGEQVGAIHVA